MESPPSLRLTKKQMQTWTTAHCLNCVCVMTKERKIYMRITCFMQFQLSLLLRLFYYCQLSKYTSAPLDSSQCLTAYVFLNDPPPSSSLLTKSSSTDICAALLLPVVKPFGTEMKKVTAHSPPNPFLLHSFSRISALLQQRLLQRWDTWWPPHTHLSQKQRFKSWSEIQNITDQA